VIGTPYKNFIILVKSMNLSLKRINLNNMENKEQIIATINNAEFDCNGEPLYSYEQVVKCMELYASQPINSGWVSVREKMPNGTHENVLVSTLKGEMGVINKFLLTRSQDLYWMPLPAKPSPPKQ